MDVECAESQTSRMSRMLLTHSLLLKKMIKDSTYKDPIPFDLIDKICVILADIYRNAHELGEKSLIQIVPLEHLHFFFVVLHMNVRNIDVSFLPDLYEVFKLKLWPRSTIDISLDSMKFMDETLCLLFPAGFADCKEGEEPNLKTKRSQIRILMKNVKTMIPVLQDHLNITRNSDKATLDFVKKLQEYPNPVSSCLANSPSAVCAICHHQQMAEVGFAALDCCPQLFCIPCLKKYLRKRGKCPACRGEIFATVSSSYMKRPAFKSSLPAKYDLIFHTKGFIGRLW